MPIKRYKRRTKDLIVAGVTLGAGASVLGAMGQPGIASKIVTPAAGMMGVAAGAMGAAAVMDVMRQKRNGKKEYY